MGNRMVGSALSNARRTSLRLVVYRLTFLISWRVTSRGLLFFEANETQIYFMDDHQLPEHAIIDECDLRNYIIEGYCC